jgi:hypothetical protein
MIIVKNRVDSSNWIVYHKGINPAGYPEDWYLMLHVDDGRTLAGDAWGSTAPGSSVYNVGAFNNTNGSGDGMIAYCFHSVEGFSKFGSYTGGGSGSAPGYDGTFVYLGFRPSWLLIKRSNAGGDPWILLDSTRDTNNFAFRASKPDLNDSEISSGDQFATDFLSNGFKCRSNNAAFNLTGATYVYAAFAESPFGGQNVSPATAR